jgi:hypothetical protein
MKSALKIPADELMGLGLNIRSSSWSYFGKAREARLNTHMGGIYTRPPKGSAMSSELKPKDINNLGLM